MTYESNWKSLREHPTPSWFRDSKFGIYTHWGVYSVPAWGKNGTWYPYFMHQEGTPHHEHQVSTYGPLSEFGYKDFIPMFTAEKFDPDQWAELFRDSGARFAGPVAEHHDGFAMWDTKLSDWHAAAMGPKRDVVGELERSIRKAGMRYLVALHHAENWWFYPHWEKAYDTSDPAYQGLYGEPHDLQWAGGAPEPTERVFDFWHQQQRPNKRFHELWLGKAREVVDKYRPDYVWFDFAIDFLQEDYVRQFLAHYYNKAEKWGREVVVTYKMHHMVPGSAVIDLELGRFDDLTYHDWITDTSVDDRGAWSYVEDAGFKSAGSLVHNLVDNVSKNGYLLLNVGPKPNGEIPEAAEECLRGIGKWLAVNGEAIFETTPWVKYGEGPTQMGKAGPFSERQEVAYTGRDIRFTAKGDTLYAICLGWPAETVRIEALGRLYEAEIEGITMVGDDRPLQWKHTTDWVEIRRPEKPPCENAFVFRIKRKPLS